MAVVSPAETGAFHHAGQGVLGCVMSLGNAVSGFAGYNEGHWDSPEYNDDCTTRNAESHKAVPEDPMPLSLYTGDPIQNMRRIAQ